VNPFPSFFHKKRSSLHTIAASLAFIAAILFSWPSQAQAQSEDIARDLANPFSSLWNVVNQINLNRLKGGLFLESHTQFNWNL